MENKNQRVYYVEYTDFEDLCILGHGIESFMYDHRNSASPRDWLGKMFDVCMDHDHATVYVCDVDGFDRCSVVPVFLYTENEGYMLNALNKFCVSVVDPTLEDFDCFIDTYEAFAYASLHSVTASDGSIILVNKDILDKKYLLSEGDL